MKKRLSKVQFVHLAEMVFTKYDGFKVVSFTREGRHPRRWLVEMHRRLPMRKISSEFQTGRSLFAVAMKVPKMAYYWRQLEAARLANRLEAEALRKASNLGEAVDALRTAGEA